MANTTTINGTTIEITGLDANWIWDQDLPTFFQSSAGIFIRSVEFHPSAIDDIMRIRQISVSGGTMFYCQCADKSDSRIKTYPREMFRPVIKIADCTLSTAANARVIIEMY